MYRGNLKDMGITLLLIYELPDIVRYGRFIVLGLRRIFIFCCFCSILLMAEAVSSATFQCLPCPPGRISSSGGGCADCAVGTYSPGIGRASCDAIPAGHRCLVSYGQSTGTSAGCIDTTPCLAGTFRPAGTNSNNCKTCNPGQSSGVGATTCSACPPGHTSGGPQNRCRPCNPGYYAAGSGNPACTPIPQGHGCLATNAGGCTGITLCAAGTYRPRATESNSCLNCPAGTTSSQGSTSSSQCQAQCTNTQYPTYSQAYNSPRGLVQGYCHTANLGCSSSQHCATSANQSWTGKTWEGSNGGVSGGGQYCFCRTKSYGTNQCGAWSSWVYFSAGGNASYCASYCADDCAAIVDTSWGGAARW